MSNMRPNAAEITEKIKMIYTEEYFIYLQNCREYEERPLTLIEWQREKTAVAQCPAESDFSCQEPLRDYSQLYNNEDFLEWAEF